MSSQTLKIFLKSFFLQLFDIGYSTGSLFSEILGVFRTFQRFSASQSFSTRFSDQCLRMFEWAKNIYSNILSFFPADPLTDFELFYSYTFGFPLMMLMFICTLATELAVIYHFLIFGLFLSLGVGIGYIGINLTISISLIICSIVLIIIGFIFRKKLVCSCFNSLEYLVLFKDNDKDFKKTLFNHCEHYIPFTLSLTIAFSIFSMIMVPIFRYRYQLSYMIMIFTPPICVLCVVIESVLLCCWKSSSKKKLEKITVKSISFIMNCFTLLIIPSTEYFVRIMHESYRNYWNCIVSYIGAGLLLPITLVFLLIRNESPDITEKYNTYKYGFLNYYYIEIIDIIKQVAYALFAAYDVYYGCLLLEISWVMLILSLLPYQKKSEYSLSLGNSLIMFISNGTMIYSELKGNVIISNTVSIIFVILSCIPAISSLYVYFIYDFEIIEVNDQKSEDDLDDINESKDQLEQKEIDDIDEPNNQLDPKKQNDIDEPNNQLDLKKQNDIDEPNNQLDLKKQNEINEPNNQIVIPKTIFPDSEFTVKIGNDKRTDNIAQSILALTPFVFFFYGLSISLVINDIKL